MNGTNFITIGCHICGKSQDIDLGDYVPTQEEINAVRAVYFVCKEGDCTAESFVRESLKED